MWTSTRGEGGPAHVGRGRGQKRNFFVDVINGWPLIMYRKYVRKWWLLKRNRIICLEIAVNSQFLAGKSKFVMKLRKKSKFVWNLPIKIAFLWNCLKKSEFLGNFPRKSNFVWNCLINRNSSEICLKNRIFFKISWKKSKFFGNLPWKIDFLFVKLPEEIESFSKFF